MSRSTDGERRRAIYQETLVIPIGDIETAAMEVQKLLHAQATKYAGPMPGLDAAQYVVWRNKLEAFSFMVSKIVAGREEP